MYQEGPVDPNKTDCFSTQGKPIDEWLETEYAAVTFNPINECYNLRVPVIYGVEGSSSFFFGNESDTYLLYGQFFLLEDSAVKCYHWFDESTPYVTDAIAATQNTVTCGTPTTNTTGLPPPSVRVTVKVYSVSAVNSDFTYCQSWTNQPMNQWVYGQYALITFTNGQENKGKNVFLQWSGGDR